MSLVEILDLIVDLVYMFVYACLKSQKLRKINNKKSDKTTDGESEPVTDKIVLS